MRRTDSWDDAVQSGLMIVVGGQLLVELCCAISADVQHAGEIRARLSKVMRWPAATCYEYFSFGLVQVYTVLRVPIRSSPRHTLLSPSHLKSLPDVYLLFGDIKGSSL